MTTHVFCKRSRIAASARETFDWHARPGAFERLAPPWEVPEVVSRTGGIEPGAEVVLRVPMGPFKKTWVAHHEALEDGRSFRDVQKSGPFASFRHTHTFLPEGPEACILEDRIEYALPLGALGDLFGGGFSRGKLERMFAYRHRVTATDLAEHARRRGEPRWTVLVSGATGMVGGVLGAFLSTGGHRVEAIRRLPGAGPSVTWDESSLAQVASLPGPLAIVHLAGENVGGKRWSADQKERIRASRWEGTARLCEAIVRSGRLPDVFVGASATGYYGDRGDELLDESSSRGEGFLAEVCEGWEAATAPLAALGVRVPLIRIGVVLSPAGGALAKMLPVFRAGLGGPLGSGRQFMSWIAIDDAVYAIHHAMMEKSLSGPVNVVSPNPVTNEELSRTLGHVLGRPAFLPAPAFALRAAFGEMAALAVLGGARVAPRRLLESGFVFRYPELEGALRHLLGRTGE